MYMYTCFHSFTKKFHIKFEEEKDYCKMFSKTLNKALKLKFSPQFLSL